MKMLICTQLHNKLQVIDTKLQISGQLMNGFFIDLKLVRTVRMIRHPNN